MKIILESDFEEVFKTHFNHLVLYVDTIVNSENISEDLVQDLFVKLWENRSKLSITPVFLFVCAKNSAISYLRTKKMTCDIMDISISDEDFENKEQLIEYYKKIEEITSKIMTLSPMCKKTLEKIYFENKKYSEAASDLGISINTVKYHLKVAINLLRKDFVFYLLYFLP